MIRLIRKVEEEMRTGPVWAVAALLISSLVSACGPNEGVLKSGRSNAVKSDPALTQSSLESDVEAMRTANFEFIFVIRRRDGSEIDAEDRGVIKLQTDGVNRRISSDNGKAFVLGSKSAIPADKLAALYDRFAVENYSPPENLITNGNVNVK